MQDGFISQPRGLSGQKVFVAGHAGLVGSAVVRRLQGEDCEILTVPRDELDLRDRAAVQQYFILHNPKVVVICAAVVGGILANQNRPAEFFTDNILIQESVIKAAYESGVEKLVFLGSSCIYPKDAVSPISEEALGSGDLEPTNEGYARAKIAGIEMVQAYRAQYGCDYISLMPCNLYGEGDRFDLADSHVIPALMMKAHAAKISGGVFEVWGSGAPLREFLYVDDLADGIVFALKHYSSDKPLNIGARAEITIRDLAGIIADVVGFKGEIIFDASRPDGVSRKLMDSSRVYEAGWTPQTPLRLGLEKTYAWYCQHIAGAEKAA